ncbi:GNAT family N-acetyltransferase [Robiginitalea marina]|uniref:GNAT family N-acetyltransferase n=1 Tax=Robiginitalea marina TaxID=2954105 RepID=A0ABT1AV89_9FLAO|nr:GNAT family N-acetyltransferase [Robiginitalea marina]MCO5723917.1 GNAT family N-acetyltransferase [Robiginitalea marina]
MIRKLDHKDPSVAGEIREVFQASYAVEAKLLGAVDFPPLKRPLEGFLQSGNEFFGFKEQDRLAGVAEVVPGEKAVHIQSLLVHPEFFRKGIGSALISHVLERYATPVITVETGLENHPATALYRKFGFREVGQYDTDHGVRKIRFEKRNYPHPASGRQP